MSDIRRIIDPTYFDEAIAEFHFEYDWYVEVGKKADSLGRLIHTFDKRKIMMSLQPQDSTLNQSKDANTQSLKYEWYCKAEYRVNIGDFFQDETGNFLHVDGVHPYDGWGVRRGTCTMVNLAQYKNFQDYIAYLNGEKII